MGTQKSVGMVGQVRLLMAAVMALLTVTAVMTAQDAKGIEDVDTYWPDTSLNFFLAMKMVNNKNCYNSEIDFLGCVGGVNELAAQLKPVAKLQPVWNHRPPENGVIQFGSVALVDHVKEDLEGLSTREIWQRSEEKRDAYNDKMADLFQASQSGQVNPVDFESVLLEIKREINEPGRVAELASYVINGYLKAAVDPHTYIIPAKYMEDRMASSNDSYAGVGMHMMTVQDHVILRPMEGRPAAKAGVMAGDILTHVDGENVQGMESGKIVSMVKGPEGTRVTITVLRDGESVDIPIERKVVTIENVTHKVVNHVSKRIGYLKIRSFSDRQLCTNVEDAVRDLQKKGVHGLVLDLRGNPGGLLGEAICVGGLFVGQKVIVQVRNLNAKSKRSYRSRKNQITDLPMVTLIDAGSASAAEILSGALQDHQRSWVLGERSYGKGSVQSPQSFLTDHSVKLYRTIQVFYQPLGRTNQASGIYPDFEVPFKPDATEDERFVMREEDTYSNAIAAESKEWVQSRPQQVEELQECMQASGVAEALYGRDPDGSSKYDSNYQLYKAQDLLNCSL